VEDHLHHGALRPKGHFQVAVAHVSRAELLHPQILFQWVECFWIVFGESNDLMDMFAAFW
jgi:hypothetical protein